MKERRQPRLTPDEREIREFCIKRGREAWQRHVHKGGATWSDWMAIGEALLVGHQDAMAATEANHPIGHRYDSEFGTWLTCHRFDAIDAGDRTRLIEVMDNLPAIEAWRAALTLTARLRLNHPSNVLRKWKSGTDVQESKRALRDSVAILNEHNLAKDRRIAELEARLQEAESVHNSGTSIDAWIDGLLNKPHKKRAESLYELLRRLELSLCHLDDAHEAYGRRLGPR
jgi:hypothetical protein